jgi:uncharacterized membrane-anchored protein YhcB (DUF1043 family)
MEEWIGKNLPWVITSGILLIGWLVRFIIKANKSKERLDQVAKNEEAIKALQTEMTNIKGDLGEIKEGVDKQGNDTAAMMKCLQSIMNALYDNDCNIGPARDRFNDYLSDRQ